MKYIDEYKLDINNLNVVWYLYDIEYIINIEIFIGQKRSIDVALFMNDVR